MCYSSANGFDLTFTTLHLKGIVGCKKDGEKVLSKRVLKGREGLQGALTDCSLTTDSCTENEVKQISQNCLSIYRYDLSSTI